MGPGVPALGRGGWNTGSQLQAAATVLCVGNDGDKGSPPLGHRSMVARTASNTLSHSNLTLWVGGSLTVTPILQIR